MSRASRALGRVTLLVAVALGLQSSTCHAHFCSGDDCDDDEKDDSATQTIVVPPLRDPWGRPLSGPVQFRFRQP